MRSLRLTALLFAVCLLALPTGLLNKPAEVQAWSNWVSGPNSYGTHDWILKKAIKTLKRRNNTANWVKLQAALWATDDPDTRNGIEYASSPWWHVYDVHGDRYGNAPEAIKFWFQKAAKQLAGKHRTKASRSLGKLAHLLGDLANPLHTDQTSREDGIHSSYEHAVDTRSGKRDRTFRFHYDGRHSGKPGSKAKHVAAASHRFYKGLGRSYGRNGYSHGSTESPSGSSTVVRTPWPISQPRSRLQPSVSAMAVVVTEAPTAPPRIRTFAFPLRHPISIAPISATRTSGNETPGSPWLRQ